MPRVGICSTRWEEEMKIDYEVTNIGHGVFDASRKYGQRGGHRTYFASDAHGRIGVGDTAKQAIADLRFEYRTGKREGCE
jgi:hypothetical protein